MIENEVVHQVVTTSFFFEFIGIRAYLNSGKIP